MRHEDTPIPRSSSGAAVVVGYRRGRRVRLGSTLLGFIISALEKIGQDLEHPFNHSVHDVALTSICRTIEINLKQYLGETDLPAPIQPVRGVLW